MAQAPTDTAHAAITPPSVARLSFADWTTIIVLLVGHAALTTRFWFVCDDAFITFRYARNWAETGRIFYNVGDSLPVEGYSNFLWMALSAAAFRLGLDPLLLMPLASAICGAVLLLLVYFAARSSAARFSWPAAFVAASLACATPYAVWSTSGLETMPFALTLFIAAYALILEPSRVAPVIAALAALLAALLRVEGILWALAVLPLAVWTRAARGQRWLRPLSTYTVLLFVGFGAYFAWRYAYFGSVLANSATAKVGLNGGHLVRGLNYVLEMALTYPPLFLAALAWIPAFRRGRRCIGPPIAALALAFPAYAILAGGDFMAFGRFLIPGLPFLAIAIGWLLEDLWRGGRAGQLGAIAMGLCCWCLGLAPGWDLHVVPEAARARFHFRLNSPTYRSEYQQWRFQNQTAADFARKGLALRQATEPGDSMVEVAIGAVGFYSGLEILDQVGLVTPLVARQPPRPDVWRSPGHDRWVEPTFFLEAGLKPTILASMLTPPLARARLGPAINGWLASLRLEERWARDFVFDFRAVQIRDETAGELCYLLLMRRIEDPQEANKLRQVATERVKRHIGGSNDDVIEIDPPR